MKKLWLIVAVCLMAGYILLVMWDAAAPARNPREAKTTSNPSVAQIKALEARMDHLEAWAVRHGGKFK